MNHKYTTLINRFLYIVNHILILTKVKRKYYITYLIKKLVTFYLQITNKFYVRQRNIYQLCKWQHDYFKTYLLYLLFLINGITSLFEILII